MQEKIDLRRVEVVRLNKEGFTQMQIARKLGISQALVSADLNALRYAQRRASGISSDDEGRSCKGCNSRMRLRPCGVWACPVCDSERSKKRYYAIASTPEGREELRIKALQRYRSRKEKDSPKILRAQRLRRQRLRLAALTYYGGKPPRCACCNEMSIEFLTIDHINGDGAKHRRELHAAGSGIYDWLRKNKYPPGFRVLCMNCNWSIGQYGYCPHEQARHDKGCG